MAAGPRAPRPPAARTPALDPAGIAHPRPRAKGQALWNPSLAFRRSAQAARAVSRTRLHRPERPRAQISLTKPRTPRPRAPIAPPHHPSLLRKRSQARWPALRRGHAAVSGGFQSALCSLPSRRPPWPAPPPPGPRHGSVPANRRRQKTAEPGERPSIESSARTGPRLSGGVLRPHGPSGARQNAAARHSSRKLIPRLAVSGCSPSSAARRAPWLPPTGVKMSVPRSTAIAIGSL